jgi:hypothetical protein
MTLFSDTGTRLRAPNVTGPDGATIPGDWSTATEGSLLKVDYACELQPLTSTEDVVGQQRTKSTHRVFLPAGADVKATDRFRFYGVDYEIEGEPERWRIRGREHHVELFVFRVTGG